MTAGTSLPGLLWRNAARWPTRPAWRWKRLGIWQTFSWAEFAGWTGALALGLAARGFGPGERLAVLGDNRPDLYAALLAAQTLGGAGVPLDPDAMPATLAAMLRDADVAVVVVDSAERAERLRALAAALPRMPRIIVADPAGLGRTAAEQQPSLAGLAAAGRAIGGDRPDPPVAALARVAPGDTALLLYPGASRAGARPAVLTHARLLSAAAAIDAADPVSPTDRALCYLPMHACDDAVYSLALGLLGGFSCNCPESPASVPRDLREIGPTILFASPAACVALADLVQSKAVGASPFKRRVVGFFLRQALRAEALRAQGSQVPPGLNLGCRIGEVVACGPARDQLGLGRIRWMHAGAPAPADAGHLLRALGVALRPGDAEIDVAAAQQGEALHA